MSATFRSRQLRNERTQDQRFIAQQRDIAARMGAIVNGYAVGQDRTVPNLQRTRTIIKEAIWSQVLKPYHIGQGDNPFSGNEPRSTYARLLYDGIYEATKIQVERQAAIIRNVTRNDDMVYRWLTGARPTTPVFEVRQNSYDPFHLFVDQRGYKLSDRVWNNAIDVRTRIDRLLDYHIAQGTSAVDIADLLEDFMTPGAKLIKTNAPYGKEGSYATRRLARTEITAASGRATVNASAANPFVDDIKWQLSASHTRERCSSGICDDNAAGGKDGDGVYAIDKVPQYPAHPHDMCVLIPVVNKDSATLVKELRADIQAQNPRARELQGVFNMNWLTNALMNEGLGAVIEKIKAIL